MSSAVPAYSLTAYSIDSRSGLRSQSRFATKARHSASVASAGFSGTSFPCGISSERMMRPRHLSS